MSQVDYTINSNEPIVNTRTDIMAFAQAILTQNSGNTAPVVKYEGMFWADTTTNLLKQWHDPNWLIISELNKVGNLSVNAGNPNGAVTGLYEGQLLFDTSNNIPWYYSGSGTSWLTANGTLSSFNLPANYHDVRINYTDANTITVLADSRVRSSDDTTDIIFSANRTCVLNASGANGLDTGSEASNTWYYLYAIYNPTTLTSALLFSTVNETVTGSITLPSGFTKKRQLRFAVRNNASSNIIPFRYYPREDLTLFRDYETTTTYQILTTGASTTFATVASSSLIPEISRRGALLARINGNSAVVGRGLYLRETGSGLTTGKYYPATASAYGAASFSDYNVQLNSSQQFDYKVDSGGASCSADLFVMGFYNTEVK